MKKKIRKPMHWALLILTHVAVLGIMLVIYVLPHHVFSYEAVDTGITSSREVFDVEPQITPVPVVKTDAETDTAALPTVEPTDAPGSFKIKYADKFSDGSKSVSNGTYTGPYCSVTVTKGTEFSSNYTIADIYVSDVSCIVSGFAKDAYGRNYEWITDIAERNLAIACINGDFYCAGNYGVVIRNGKLYRAARSGSDICVLYWDGTMKVVPHEKFNAEKQMKLGAYQAWSFGPSLLTSEGEAIQSFEGQNLRRANPRTAIGYFEPGHYCFVVVDGRQKNSRGMTLEQLSALMAQIGCKVAYNLDGGESSSMVVCNKLYTSPANGGRAIADTIMVLDEP